MNESYFESIFAIFDKKPIFLFILNTYWALIWFSKYQWFPTRCIELFFELKVKSERSSVPVLLGTPFILHILKAKMGDELTLAGSFPQDEEGCQTNNLVYCNCRWQDQDEAWDWNHSWASQWVLFNFLANWASPSSARSVSKGLPQLACSCSPGCPGRGTNQCSIMCIGRPSRSSTSPTTRHLLILGGARWSQWRSWTCRPFRPSTWTAPHTPCRKCQNKCDRWALFWYLHCVQLSSLFQSC